MMMPAKAAVAAPTPPRVMPVKRGVAAAKRLSEDSGFMCGVARSSHARGLGLEASWAAKGFMGILQAWGATLLGMLQASWAALMSRLQASWAALR